MSIDATTTTVSGQFRAAVTSNMSVRNVDRSQKSVIAWTSIKEDRRDFVASGNTRPTNPATERVSPALRATITSNGTKSADTTRRRRARSCETARLCLAGSATLTYVAPTPSSTTNSKAEVTVIVTAAVRLNRNSPTSTACSKLVSSL